MTTKRFIKKPVLLALILILVVGAIYYIESQKPDIQDITQPSTQENQLTEQSPTPTTEKNAPRVSLNAELKKARYKQAPDFRGIEHWINTEPLTINDLKGKVVLVDFWTYSCINCIRTLPYITQWDEKYRDDGLVIVGVHTPEFKFEEKTENVQEALTKYNIKYPIAQDNDYGTWRAYENRYWPHKFLIDADGYIRYDHIGEGGYEETEKTIQLLLKERMEALGKNEEIDQEITAPGTVTSVDFSKTLTPEIYLGRMTSRGHFGNDEGLGDQPRVYTLPKLTQPNTVYIQGSWRANPEYLELIGDEGIIQLTYSAKSVNIVAEAELEKESRIEVNLNGNKDTSGNDVKDGSILIKEPRLYNVVQTKDYETNTIQLHVKGKRFRIYTFTFG